MKKQIIATIALLMTTATSYNYDGPRPVSTVGRGAVNVTVGAAEGATAVAAAPFHAVGDLFRSKEEREKAQSRRKEEQQKKDDRRKQEREERAAKRNR